MRVEVQNKNELFTGQYNCGLTWLSPFGQLTTERKISIKHNALS